MQFIGVKLNLVAVSAQFWDHRHTLERCIRRDAVLYVTLNATVVNTIGARGLPWVKQQIFPAMRDLGPTATMQRSGQRCGRLGAYCCAVGLTHSTWDGREMRPQERHLFALFLTNGSKHVGLDCEWSPSHPFCPRNTEFPEICNNEPFKDVTQFFMKLVVNLLNRICHGGHASRTGL